MFGFSKKKAIDKQFALELANIASEFSYVADGVEDGFSDELMSRAFDTYLECNPEEAEYSASDFYLNSFVGALGHATIEGFADPQTSLANFVVTNNFLDGHPQYHTPLVMEIMNNWQTILVHRGAIQL